MKFIKRFSIINEGSRKNFDKVDIVIKGLLNVDGVHIVNHHPQERLIDIKLYDSSMSSKVMKFVESKLQDTNILIDDMGSEHGHDEYYLMVYY